MTALFQLWLVASAAVIGALMLGPYVVVPLRERLCPHRGDGVWLLRSRYDAMLAAIEAQRVENAELREQLRLTDIGRLSESERNSLVDALTARRAEEWLKNLGAK